MENKKRIIMGLIVLLIVLGIIIVLLINKDRDKDPLITDYQKIESVIPKEVLDIYNTIDIGNCSNVLIWRINDNEKLTIKNMNENNIFNMVFKRLKLENKLNDEFNYSDYTNALSNIFGLENNYKIDFKDFDYDGYKYNISGSKIIRESSPCLNEVNYISNLYGYSYNNDGLLVYVNVGILKDNIIYDLDNKEIGIYNEEELKKILNKSQGYLYTYRKTSESYYLESVEKVKKEFK